MDIWITFSFLIIMSNAVMNNWTHGAVCIYVFILFLTDLLVGKDLDAGKDWRQKEKEVAEGEMVR